MKRTLLMLLFSSTIICAQSKLTPEQRIDTLFSKYNSTTPGVSIAVVQDGNIIFKKGYGIANLEYDIPITPQTIFLTASVSKQFTAFSIYLLAQQGKLSIDDDIRIYLPEVPDFGKPITIKHLLYHTSGLKEELSLLSFAGWRMDELITTEHILKLVNRQTALAFETGTQFQYSNTGYTFLAEIVKRVSGKSFAEFTKENIFDVLGMSHTQFYDDHEKIIKNRAYSYDFENGVYKKENLNDISIGSSGLYSTVEDLSLWSNHFNAPTITNKEFIKAFNQAATLDNGQPAFLYEPDNIIYAKGQVLRNYRGLNTYIHTGSQAGFKAYLGRFPDDGLTIITLSNDMSFMSYPISMQIAEFYLHGKMLEIPASRPVINSVEEDLEVIDFNTDLTDMIGTYTSSELLSSFSINKTDEDDLVLTNQRLSDMILTRNGDLNFSGVNYYNFKLEFIKAEDNSVIGFNIIDFRGDKLNFQKAN